MNLTRRSLLTLSVVATAVCASSSSFAQSKKHKRVNPVLFWNAVALDLVAFDHSVEPAIARAPGPCASARALGVVHAAIADAVHFAYPSSYKPRFYRSRVEREIENPDLFVGGAAYAVLSYIFDTQMHRYLLETGAEGFKKLVGAWGSIDWEAGMAFGNSPPFRKLWVWGHMQQSLLPQFSNYVPKPRQHNIDPYNAGQGFYGVGWGSYQPLILTAPEVSLLSPEVPPPEGSPEYEKDLAEVRVKGALQSKATKHFAARTPHETNVGLFWAYDGARLLGTPPRLYNQIVRQIAIQDEMSVVEMARLFALCNLAMADASTVAWWAKYRYNVWRPILGIQNRVDRPEQDWLPLGAPKTNAPRPAEAGRESAQSLISAAAAVRDIGAAEERKGKPSERAQFKQLYGRAAFTPNFPAYPSGHSIFGSACFNMVKLCRSERAQTEGNPDAIRGEFISDELNGVSSDPFHYGARPHYPIAYKSLDDMIEDNALSRVYLGVHWRFDCNRGVTSGARIARVIYNGAYGPYEPPPRRGS